MAFDSIHSRCIEKTICNQFSDEIIEESLEADPVKRTFVTNRRVARQRGHMRWACEGMQNVVSRIGRKIGRRMGWDPDNRRQSPTVMGSIINSITNLPKPPITAVKQ